MALPAPLGAIVLAGGRARRLGGIDKMAVRVGGRPLLDRVVAALADAQRVVVVGPVRATAFPVVWASERPAGSGPVAALAAGLRRLSTDLVAVVAGDLPFVERRAIARLVAAAAHADAALAVDRGGRLQPLLGVYRVDALRRALAEIAPVEGAAMTRMVAALGRVVTVPGPDSTDVDTPAALERARMEVDADG